MNGRNSGIVINPHYLICHQDTKTRTVNFINPGESRVFLVCSLKNSLVVGPRMLGESNNDCTSRLVWNSAVFSTQFARMSR